MKRKIKSVLNYLKKNEDKIEVIKDHLEFKSIHHVSSAYLESFYKYYQPVFILNTGRSGSAFMQTVFNNFNALDAHHEAFPNLFSLSNFSFNNQSNNLVLKKIFEAARLELILNSAIKNKIYIESNQCLVFYVNQIKEMFPKAKFIHLTRHPGDFVKSAIMKGWHKNDSVWENGRIKSSDTEKWNRFSHIEKLAWVWNETHQLIEYYKENDKENFITIRLEDLVSDLEVFDTLFSFINIKNVLSEDEMRKLLNAKVNKVLVSATDPENMYKRSQYPKYKDWPSADKQELKAIVADLSHTYKYNL